MPQRRKIDEIREPSLFGTDETHVPNHATDSAVERLINDPCIIVGTSAFTANGWPGSFYPVGMKSTEYLSHYASRFRTVEIDSTYYGPPAASTVENWYRKTPADFIFAAKIPQTVTHDKALFDCEPEFDEFMGRIGLLREKLGPLLFQFPHFDRYQFKTGTDFLARLRPFLKELPANREFVVEIRNKTWLNTELTDALREHHVALALTDTSFMPRPWELKEPLDLITSDFTYIRWLGNRKEIETHTTTWDKTIIDRTDDLRHWVQLCREFVAERKLKRLFLFGNNHYQGHGPDTAKRFWELWNE
jgi:uncharacterized protein YecE (DUF72 family)